MAPVVVPGVDVALLTGPLVLGYIFSSWLYGVLVVQVYLFAVLFPKERFEIKAIVYSMFAVETLFTLFTTIAAWNQYGPGWGDPRTLSVIDWAWDPLPALNGVVAAIAQSFYLWRVWSLTRRMWMPILIGCVMVTQLVASFYYGIAVSIKGRTVEALFALSPEITLWLAGSGLCDLLITCSLVYILVSRKRDTHFQRISGLLTRLIRFSVETGAITSVVAVTELVLWLTSSQWNIHFIFFLVLGKLYSNMLVATLNSRAPLFGGTGGLTTTSAPGAGTVSMFWADMTSTTATAQTQTQTQGHRSTNISRPTHEEVFIDPDRDILVMNVTFRAADDDEDEDER
ncbi:hypothetical protein C8R46DRAFT_1207232 [Mycena filopes]|nr:hypothetical protein C8R46DRAFT_1207232 [Mycena filopes]